MDGCHDDINTVHRTAGAYVYTRWMLVREEHVLASEGAVLVSEGELPHSGLVGQCCHHPS